MAKEILRFWGIVTAICFAAISCEEKVPEDGGDNTGPDDKVEVVAPIVSVEVTELERTSVSFTIKSDSPGDYAWTIVPASEAVANAEDLFKSGNTGMFGSSNTAEIVYNELEGGNKYMLYAAVRKINPYVYSELVSEEVSTEFAYESLITLEKVSTNAISYHIEMPEGMSSYKHMIVDYNDFLYFQALVGVTHSSYLSAFGLSGTESKTYDYEWVQMDAYGESGVTEGYPTYFYSDTKYLIIAGESDGTGLDAQVANAEYIEFTTPKAEECPHKVNVEVTDISSIKATVTLTPEEGVDRYRAMVLSEADYQSFLFEGEEMLRRVVIGPWEDTSTEFTEAVSMPLSGLVPDSNYYVCIVVFDEDMRELYIEEVFTTTEPVGPKPEIAVEPLEVAEPWCSASVNLKIKHAVSAMSFVHTRLAVDNVLTQPGNEDLTIEDLIPANGVSFTANELEKALSEDGCTVSFTNLSPNTEYVYAISATNEERVTSCHVYEFKTGAEPVVETTLFEKLQGEYTASIKDIDGKSHTFDVTITDGVNDATRADYAAENLLVCLGFDPIGVKYHSPQDLLDKGWAKDEAEANRNYGPKWFLEIDKNDRITTYKHAVSDSWFDEVNQAEIISYSGEGEDPMASFDGNTYWFKGTYERYFQNKGTYEIFATTLIHNVDFNEEEGTITVKPVTHYKSWSAKGQSITEYPGVEQGPTWYSGSMSKVVFCGDSPLVLTKKKTPAASSASVVVPSAEPLAVPVVVPFNVLESRPLIRR